MTCTPCKTVPFLRNRVTLQKRKLLTTPDAAGHVDMSDADNWQDVAERACKIVTRGGAESYRFNQVQADVSYLIDLRSDSVTRTVDPTWRLSLDGRTLSIVAAFDVDEQRQTVRIQASEQV